MPTIPAGIAHAISRYHGPTLEGMHALTLLRNRRVAELLAVQILSQTSLLMQAVALAWLVFDVTGSSGAVGLVVGAGALPFLMLGLLGGRIADQFERWTVMRVAQCAYALTAVAFYLVARHGTPSVVLLAALSGVQGVAGVVNDPARFAALFTAAGPDLRESAVGMNSAVFNVSGVLGPVLATVVLGLGDADLCFLISALMLLTGLLVLWLDTSQQSPEPAVNRGSTLRALITQQGVRQLLTALLICSILTLNYTAVLAERAGGDEVTFGALESLRATGGLAGALLLMIGRRRMTARVALSAMAVGLLIVAFAPGSAGAGAGAFLAGVGAVVAIGQWRSALAGVDTAMVGTAMALFGWIVIGSRTIGQPLVGYLGSLLGLTPTLCLLSMASALGAIISVNGNPPPGRAPSVVDAARADGQVVDAGHEPGRRSNERRR